MQLALGVTGCSSSTEEVLYGWMAADLVPLRFNLLFGPTTRSLAICTSTGAERRCPAHHFILISLMRDTCREGITQSCNAALRFAWKVSNHVRDILLLERGVEKKDRGRGADDWGMRMGEQKGMKGRLYGRLEVRGGS